MAADPIAPAGTVEDLGRAIKRKYPAYQQVPDAELGRRVKAKYPTARAYQGFSDVAPTPRPTLNPTVATPNRPTIAVAPSPTARPLRPARPAIGPAIRAILPSFATPEVARGFRSGLAGQNVEAVGRTLEAAGQIPQLGPLRGPVSRAGGALRRAGGARAEQPKVASFKDVRSARELFDYLQFSMGQAVASTVPSVAGAAAGTLAGAATAGPAGAIAGGIAGATLPAYSLNFGDVAEEVDAALPNASAAERSRVAALIALPVTALDALPGFKFGTKAAKKVVVQKVLAEATKRGLLKAGVAGAALEALPEAAQETIQALSVAAAAGKPVDVDELVARAVDAGIGGALAGGVIGAGVEAIPQRRGPSAADAAAVRANIQPPAKLSIPRAAAAREASVQLASAVTQIQAANPSLSFESPGLKVESAYVVPSLVRVFPGDPNPVRVTVVDKANGRMHSLSLPSVKALRTALSAYAPAEAPGVPQERILPRRGEGPAVEPEQVRAAAVGAKERAQAEAAEQAKVRASVPGRIAQLERQIAKRPNDKQVGKWRRRIEALRKQLPDEKATPIPVSPAPPRVEKPEQREAKLDPKLENLARLHMAAQVPGMGDRTDVIIVSEAMRRLTPEQRKAVRARSSELDAIRRAPHAVRPKLPAHVSEEMKRRGQKPGRMMNEIDVAQHRKLLESDPLIAKIEKVDPELAARARKGNVTRSEMIAAAREVTPSAKPGPSRIIVPNMQFSEESAARRVAVSIARDQAGAEPKVVRTKRGFEIEVNEEAGASRLKKQSFAVKPPAARPEPAAPRAAPEPSPFVAGAPVVPVRSGKGAVPEAAPAERTFVEEFEDLARQGKTLEEATAEAKTRSGSEPPAGLDLEARWSRVRRERQEQLGQTDIFGGAALLGGPGRSESVPTERAPREAPPTVAEAAPRAEKPSESKTVPLEGLWYWEGFQNREVSRGTPPTQNPSELVNAAHVRMLSETRGGFDIDEVVRRPILVWRDQAGELGEAGRRYVIDGHHRSFMAQESGAKSLPAVEVFGDLAYARSQAQLANLASVPNTVSEQARIARELRDRGDSWERVAAQLRVRTSRAKGMVDFAHLDAGVRADFYPSGNESVILGGTAHGEVVGRYARELPDLVSPDVQRQWLNQALNQAMSPTLLGKQMREWAAVLKAVKQETIDLPGGVKGVRLAMSPRQFAETSGRLTAAIQAQQRQVQELTKSLESVAEMARGAGHNEARDFVETKLAEVGREGLRLTKAQKEISAGIRSAVAAAAEGKGDVASSFDALQARVDEILKAGPMAPLTGEGGFIRIPELMEALVRALRKLTGIVRRDQVVKAGAKPKLYQEPAVVTRIIEALEKAKPVRAEQEEIRTEELGKRVAEARRRERGKVGLERYRAGGSALRGKFPKPQFESITKTLSQDNITELIQIIYKHPALDFFEQRNAIAGLQKLIGEMGVEVPQDHEIALLEIVFGERMVQALAKLRPEIEGARSAGLMVANVAKTMRTMADLSAPLRQGIYFLVSHPRLWASAFVDMHKYWWSEDQFREGMQEIYQRPNSRLYRTLALSITRPGSTDLVAQEEAFFNAKLLYKLPLVRRSDRSYSGFLNKLRADVFDALVVLAKKNGYDLRQLIDGTKLTKERRTTLTKAGRLIAEFVNAGTGRGDSGFITKHAGLLNTMFFSPRLIKSRLHLLNPKHYSGTLERSAQAISRGISPKRLTEGGVREELGARLVAFNPKHYVAAPTFLRREYLKNSLAFAGAAGIVLTLAAWAGARVEKDRLNGDFGKIRVGGVVYDVLGGFVQYARLFPAALEAFWNQMTGRPQRRNLGDLLALFAEHKLSPVGDFVLNWFRGWKMGEGGRKQLTYKDLPRETLMLFVPMIGEDFFEVMKEDPRQLPFSVPAANYGAGVQVYERPRDYRRSYAPRAPQAPRAPTAPGY